MDDPVLLVSEFHDWPPVTPTEKVAVPRCCTYTNTRSPSTIEAGGAIVMVVVAFVAAPPSTGTPTDPKCVIATMQTIQRKRVEKGQKSPRCRNIRGPKPTA